MFQEWWAMEKGRMLWYAHHWYVILLCMAIVVAVMGVCIWAYNSRRY